MSHLTPSRPALPRAAILFTALSTLLAGLPARADYRSDAHYTQLQAELGAATPTGAGVVVSQVEAEVMVDGQNVWMPATGVYEFIGKTLTDLSNGPAGLSSGHATAVGQEFYGYPSSIAGGVSTIYVYWASAWAGGNFLHTGYTGTSSARPLSHASRVVNHSWVGDAGTSDAELMRRLDWVIENDDMIHVVAQGTPQPLISNAFNVIAVGTSAGGLYTPGTVGLVAADPQYIAGRVRPDVVAPADSLSIATPRVSAAVALLVQTGHDNPALSTDPAITSYVNRAGLTIRNAERVEVVRAALMAGADRLTRNSTTADLGLYRDTPANQAANGLDTRYGAGQLDVANSYHILAAGEQNSVEDGGPGSGTASSGFDYDPAFGGTGGANTTATYPLPIAATPRLLTASLVWNLDINGGLIGSGPGATFNTTGYYYDLNLSVIDITSPSTPVTVYTSSSLYDNSENAWLVVPANAHYEIQITRVASGPPAGNMAYDYGLAWQLMADADGDGAYDGQDDCINVANGPIVRDGGGNSQRDTNSDGYGNACDADLDNNNFINVADYAILRSRLGTADADADFDGNGLVNVADYAYLRSRLGLAPGPSAYGP